MNVGLNTGSDAAAPSHAERLHASQAKGGTGASSGRPSGSEPGSVVRSAVIRFTLFSVVALVVVAAGTLLVANRLAQERALDAARTQAAGIADRLAAPLIDESLRNGDPAAMQQLDTVMSNRMRDGSVRHVKLWDESGQVLWSDQRDVIGKTFEIEPDVAALFGTTEATAEVSDLSREENFAERDEGELLEVYSGTFDADGEPVVFEAYLTTDDMDKDARTMAASFVRLFLGALALLLLVMLPLAVSLARRVERAQVDRSRMMRHALLASDLERRRIAEDLHDGVIQDLAGVGYVLPTADRELHDGGNFTRARDLLARATTIVQEDVAQLRSLMADIYPDLDGGGLRDAVLQMIGNEAAASGLEADVVIDPDLDLPLDTSRLVYRTVREGVRNVVKHADASRVTVVVHETGTEVVVRVEDDGRGLGTDPGTSAEGHHGLRLLRETFVDVGGSLDVRSGTAGGTTLEAHFPVRLLAT